MIKKIFKALAFGILALCIFALFFGEIFIDFLTNNEYLNNNLYAEYGKANTVIFLSVSVYILIIIACLILWKLIKLVYKTNQKYNLVVNCTWKDFPASWGLMFGIFAIILIITDFNERDIFTYFFLIVCGICGFVFYKNKLWIIKYNDYKGLGAILRLVITYLFGLVSLPLLIVYMPVLVIKGGRDVIESLPDVDMEIGSITDGNGNVTTFTSYSTKNIKSTSFTDKDGKKYYSNSIKK